MREITEFQSNLILKDQISKYTGNFVSLNKENSMCIQVKKITHTHTNKRVKLVSNLSFAKKSI